MRIVLPAIVSQFFEESGSKIPFNGHDWFFSSVWYKKVGVNVFEQYSFEQLPKGLIAEINKVRGVTDKLLGIEQRNIATAGTPLHITIKDGVGRKDGKFSSISDGVKYTDGYRCDELNINVAMFNKQDVEELIHLLEIAKHCFTK